MKLNLEPFLLSGKKSRNILMDCSYNGNPMASQFVQYLITSNSNFNWE